MDNREGQSKITYLKEYRKLGNIFGNKSFAREKTPADKFLYQTFIAIAILSIVLFINTINFGITKIITRNIKNALNWEIEFGSIDKVINAFKTSKPDIDIDDLTVVSEATNMNITEFILPLEGEITSLYGERIHPVFNTVKQHNGIDIDGNYGDEIKSSIDGTVVEIGEDNELGKYVRINKGVYDTLYAHCSKISVKEGQKVKQGDKIAEVGDTGYSSAPHLHFEIRVEGKAINPLEMIE